jgi:F-type H+-transporting ATPase subunit f
MFNCNIFVADTPLSQVKVGEISEWIGRRNKSPSAIAGAVSRAFWRWQHKYWQPRRAGIAPYYQAIVGSMIFFYAINYGKISKLKNSSKLQQQPDDFLLSLFTEHHRNYKYH